MFDDKSHEKTIDWSKNKLNSLDFSLVKDMPILIQDTPYSYVAKFDTNQGAVYLKHMPEKIALEAIIINYLSLNLNAPVPTVVASNEELNCFLMKDAGVSLRQTLTGNFDSKLICNAYRQFAAFSQGVIPHIDGMISLGVPDFRLDKLPGLYGDLLNQEEMLLNDGLTKQELNNLKMLDGHIASLCGELLGYPIQQTLVQPDCNDNNMLVDPLSGDVTIIDLGEIVISHPLFSLLNFLYIIKREHNLSDNGQDYLHIMAVCLDKCLGGLSKRDVASAIDLAGKLRPVYWALSTYRLIEACDREKIMLLLHGKLSATLKLLLK